MVGTRSNFDRYNTLRQIAKMEEEAERLELENYKSPWHLFLKSVDILELSKTLGMYLTASITNSNGYYTASIR